jgi:NADH:ubiquinone oxidoreductase subunit 6 (subunit J)
MSKKTTVGVLIALSLLVVLAGSVMSSSWDNMGDNPESIPFGPDGEGDLAENSLNYQLFEVWGPVLLVLGILMFGAIIAGVCISREEEDKDDSN